MRGWLLGLLGLVLSAVIAFGIMYSQRMPQTSQSSQSAQSTTAAEAGSSPEAAPSTAAAASTMAAPTTVASPNPSAPNTGNNADSSNSTNAGLEVDSSGLSHATVVMSTSAGIIKFKFYPNDAPKTVKRFMQLVNQGFYNGLTFHRVVPGFVVQGGDPVGNGTGGSGQKLDAEFNNRRHVEGAVAMARATDPNSADSQFYITLGTFPHLDHNYTVFGQVIEGLDVARKIKVGDKMTTLVIQ